MFEVYTPLSFIDQYIINHLDSRNIRTDGDYHSKSADPSELALPFVCFNADKNEVLFITEVIFFTRPYPILFSLPITTPWYRVASRKSYLQELLLTSCQWYFDRISSAWSTLT